MAYYLGSKPERLFMKSVQFTRVREAYRDQPIHRWRCDVHWGKNFVTSSVKWSKLGAFSDAVTFWWKSS